MLGYLVVGTADCTPCVENNCCDQLTAAGTNHDWYARRSCAAQCASGDDSCVSACNKAYPDGLALDIWGVSCFGSSCATECAIDPAPVCGNGYLGDPTGPCPVCIEASCCAEESACWSSLECVQSLLCSEFCETDATCLAVCDSDYPAGKALVDAAITCTDTSCGTECGGAAGAAGSGGT